MVEEKKYQAEKARIGEFKYLNKNCWLVKNLNYAPYKRCQYCGFKFRNCLFLHYQSISVFLIIFFLGLSFLVEGRIPTSSIIALFTLIIVYGYFFNKSTEKIIQANFAQQKAGEALEELTQKLEQKVDQQTKDLQEKSRHLKELLEMKTDFLRVVNHQLNTPISIMKGCFSMIREGSYSIKQAMPIIENGLGRVGSAVADFWDAYELEGERVRVTPQQTDVSEIVDKLVSEKQKLQIAQDRKLKIGVDKFSGKIPIVWCDAKKISHVISNLLDNAIYYTRSGGINIFYELSNSDLKINVKDTGSGISEGDRSKIFQKFSRGKNAFNLRPDGSGLGLFIAKKIVEANDGVLTYKSDGLNKGATFSFTLPIYKDQESFSDNKIFGRDKKIIIFN